VGQRARALAGAYGITYRTPLFPIYKRGHYGGFIGRGFDTMEEYRALVQEVRQGGGDFVKIMISGLMDFDRFGVLTSAPLEDWEIREMIRIAHEAGFSVMAHANGAQTVLAAAEAGVDSVEHGAYLSTQALEAMAAAGTVWVPTLSTIGNLRGTGRFSESDVEQILASAQARVAQFHAMGGYLAPGSDAEAQGIRVGDIVTAINGEGVRQTSDVAAIISQYDVGTIMTFTIYRDGETLQVDVTLMETSDIY